MATYKENLMRKALALFFVIVFVTPLLIATLIVVPVRTWLFNREFYYGALNHEQVLKVLQETSLPIPTNTPLPFSPELLDALFISLTTIMTPEYLDSQIHLLIDSGLDVMEGKADAINTSIDFVPLKEAIQGEKKLEFINTFATNFPVCENDEEPNLSQMLVICRPPSVAPETFAQNLLEPILPQLVQFVPDSYPIQLPFILATQKLAFWTPLFPNLSLPGFLTTAVIAITVIAFIFWVLAACVADPAWHVRLKWLGGSLIFPALVVLLLAGIVYLFTGANILDWLLRVMGVNLGGLTSALSITNQLTARIALSFFVSGGVALGIAVSLIMLAKLIHPRQVDMEKTM
jgi:hypothetical protein